MSLVNAVHTLLEVAAGRRNLSADAADELHASIEAEQAPAALEPVVAPSPPLPPASNLPEPSAYPELPAWQPPASAS